MKKDIDKWNKLYSESGGAPVAVAAVLEENEHLLPTTGNALEIACGRGANALFLARNGLTALAWDISSVAVEQINRRAQSESLHLIAEVRDVANDPPPSDSFDVVVVTHFLDRGLVPRIVAALKENGLLFYQTFTRSRVGARGPQNEEYRLADNELLDLFAALKVVVYREERALGDCSRGFRDEAMLVGQKQTVRTGRC